MSEIQPIRFGRYLLLEKIAAGGMAQLYRGKILGVQGFEKLIAVKTILPHLVSEKELVTSFIDEAKLVERLGTRGPLPVEIVPFAAIAQVAWLDSLSSRAELWKEADGSPVVTDNGNYLARCWFTGGIADPHALARTLADRPGIVGHGLFLDVATAVVVAGTGGVRVLSRTQTAKRAD